MFFFGPLDLLMITLPFSGKAMCVMEKAQETGAPSSVCSPDDLEQMCLFWGLSVPSGTSRDWTRYCQASSRHLILCFPVDTSSWGPGVRVKARVWLSREAAPSLHSGASGQKPSHATAAWREACCCLWSQAVSTMSLLGENHHSSQG